MLVNDDVLAVDGERCIQVRGSQLQTAIDVMMQVGHVADDLSHDSSFVLDVCSNIGKRRRISTANECSLPLTASSSLKYYFSRYYYRCY
jgi:hypothetical protein